jgi:hypothetical protein
MESRATQLSERKAGSAREHDAIERAVRGFRNPPQTPAVFEVQVQRLLCTADPEPAVLEQITAARRHALGERHKMGDVGRIVYRERVGLREIHQGIEQGLMELSPGLFR